MARPKQKWTFEEEEALLSGVEKYGLGRWKSILKDSQFASSLANRTNVDLKDKWRNMCVSDGGSSSRRNVKTPRIEFDTFPPLEDATSEQVIADANDVSNHNEQEMEPASAEPLPRETQEDAAMVAARQVSIAENMTEEMVKAIEEEAKLAEILHENEVMLELAKDIYARCLRDGVVYLDP